MDARRWCMVLIVLIGGCTVGPDYVRPELTTPAAWSETPSSQPAGSSSQPAAASQPADIAAWWKTLNDPTLDALIDEAVQSNLELQIATARIREARAQRLAASADFWPQVNGSGSYNYSGSSRNTQADTSRSVSAGRQILSDAVGAAGSAFNSAGTGQTAGTTSGSNLAGTVLNQISDRLGQNDTGAQSRGHNLFQAGLDATWEIDLFGGIRRSVEASEADLQAAEEARRSVLVSLLAEVAVNYVELRGTQRRLDIARSNIVTQANTLRLTQARKGAGLVSLLEVAQAEAQLQTTRSQIPVLESSIRQSIHRLSVLLGKPPGTLLATLLPAKPLPTTPPDVPLGLPSDLLRRRPDIREAERTLAAETARIGVATADLFPKVSLNGGFGTQTIDMQYFLDRNSLYWSLGPSVQWAIFQGGRIRANIEAQSARQEQALATYQQAVLTALQETEDALVAYSSEKSRYDALAAAVVANERATKLSSDLYKGGIGAFLNVLDAQRSLYSSQDTLAVSDITTMTNLVALYKALGGGWDASVQ